MAEHGLTEKTMVRIHEILSRYPAVNRAVLFGSRAKGNFKPGSDIDLAIIGSLIEWNTLICIRMAFDDSELPYQFSLIVLNEHTDPDVAAHIKRVGIPLYERTVATAG